MTVPYNGNGLKLKNEAFRSQDKMAAVLNRLAREIREAKKGDKAELRDLTQEIAEEKQDFLVDNLIGTEVMKFLGITELVRKAMKRSRKQGKRA